MLELTDHTDVIRDLNFAPDASLRLVSASRDGTLRVWQLHDGRINGSVSSQRAAARLLVGGQSKWMYGCCWSPDASLLASVGDNRSVRYFVYLFCLCTLLIFSEFCNGEFSTTVCVKVTSHYQILNCRDPVTMILKVD